MAISPKHMVILFLAIFSPTLLSKTVLKVATYPGFEDTVRAAIPHYEVLKPDVEIEVVSLEFTEHHNAMRIALSTGSNVPDVLGIESSYMGRFALLDSLESLSQPPFNATHHQSLIVPFAWSQGQDVQGQLRGMPADIGPGAMFYRRDLLIEAGVSVEDLTRDWDSFIETGKTIKKETGKYLIAHASNIKDIYIRSALKEGEGIYFDKSNNVLVNTPRFKEAFRLAKAVRDASLDAQATDWSPEWSQGLRDGSIVVQMSGSWLSGQLDSWIAPASTGLWRSEKLPNQSYVNWGGSFYAIPRKSKHKQEAWDFIQYMTTSLEMQSRAFKEQKNFPSLISAQEGDIITEAIPYLSGQQARLQWKESAANIQATALNKYDASAEEIVNFALEQVLSNNLDIDTALSTAETLLKRLSRR